MRERRTRNETRSVKGFPITQCLTLFFFLIMTVFGVSVALLVHFNMERFISKGLEDYRMRDILAVRRIVMSFMDDRIRILHDHAKFPRIVDAVTGKNKKSDISAFMDSLSIFGEKYQMVLLDKSGNTIRATRQEPWFHYNGEEWIRKIINGDFERYMGISAVGNSFFWTLAVPVFYKGKPNGFLVTEIPVKAFDAERNFSFTMRKSQVQFLLRKTFDGKEKDRVIATFGKEIQGPWAEFNLPSIGVVMRYRADRSTIIKLYKSFLTKFTIFLVGLTLITILGGIFMGRRFFAKPLMETRAAASALAKGISGVKVPVDHGIREINLLARSFNKMADKVKTRESRLLEFSEELESRVEERTRKLRMEIMDRKKAETALRKSEQRMEMALEGGNLGLWDWNTKTSEMFINDRWAEMIGYAKKDIEPHIDSWKNLIHPDDLADVMDVLVAHLDGNIPFYVSEHRLKTSSGEWNWILDRGKVVERDENGKPLRAVGTHLDINNRKRVEEEMVRIRKALECASDAIAIISEDGGHFYRNEAFIRLFGSGRKISSGKAAYLSTFDDQDEGKRILEILSEKESWSGIAEMNGKSGESITVLLRSDAIKNELDECIGYVNVITDITEKKRNRSNLRSA